MKKLIASSLAMAAMAALVSGCASVQRATPVAPGVVNINLSKGDYAMLASVKGTSTVTSYLGGIIQVIDGDKVSFLGIKMFEDQYSNQIENPNPNWVQSLAKLVGGVSVENRAYYKALAATPDADAVIPKSLVRQTSGFPILYSEDEVTFSGKAIKFNAE